jgi:mannose-6-phosphate isomerase-like protein (cupin superfamily)
VAVIRNVALFVIVLATIAAVVGAQEGDRKAARQEASARPAMLTASHPLILQEADGEQLIHTSGPLSGLPFIIKVDSENGNAQDFFVFTETLAPGQTIPFHKHHNAEEILILEEGGATVMVGDKWAVTGPRSITFIPRDTWISATNKGKQAIHVISIFSRQGFERYLRSIGAKPGTPVSPVSPDELPRLRALGHATYWDTSKGPYPPGVAHP